MARPGVTDPWWVLLTGLALLFLFGFLVPLLVFAQAFTGLARLWPRWRPRHEAAVLLTMTVAVLTVPMNTAFGIAAAWAIALFPGQARPVTFIDLPFAVSPVVSAGVRCCSAPRAVSGRG